MKSLRLFLLFSVCSVCSVGQLRAQTFPTATTSAVTKTTATNNVTADLDFGTGRTLLMESGSTLSLLGTLSGTPTGGTLNLSNTTLTLPATVSGGTSSLQPLDAELTAISGLSANGLIARTSASTAAARTLTGTAGQITVTNGDGVSGNPTLSLPATITQATTFSAATTVSNDTTATSTTTGSLINAGGLGNAGAMHVGGNFVPSQTNGIVGTTTNNNANAGSVGEYIQNSTANTSGSAVTLTSNTNVNVTSISLTAGDWDVSCITSFVITGGSATMIATGISQTSVTFGGAGSYASFTGTIAQTTFGDSTQAVPVFRVSLSGTTTVFLVARSTFPGSNLAYGILSARRVR